ncbi:MAG: UDP-N-acetylmuramate dehydrogenase [Clostridia bacterium]
MIPYKELFKSFNAIYDVPLKKLTTFKIGGNVSVVVSPQNEQEVDAFLKIVKENDINYFIMGNGSNILCSDNGFNGAILRFDRYMSQIYWENDKAVALSGAKLYMIYDFAKYYNKGGTEFMQYIPATVGGAVVNNAGCYGNDMSEIVSKIWATDGENVRIFDKVSAELCYRDSFFKHNKQWIITRVEFNLNNNFDDKKAKEIAEKKKYTQPLASLSAGSVFKRNGDIIPAKIIDELGLKGLTVGGAQVSRVHSGFIVNASHHATAEDVLALIDVIKMEVKNNYGIDLETEIEMLK